jgi:hypothetical protein
MFTLCSLLLTLRDKPCTVKYTLSLEIQWPAVSKTSEDIRFNSGILKLRSAGLGMSCTWMLLILISTGLYWHIYLIFAHPLLNDVLKSTRYISLIKYCHDFSDYRQVLHWRRIYWNLSYGSWLHFTVHCYTHISVHSHVFTDVAW